MPVEVSCAACKGRFRVPDSAAGKRIKCPKCKSPIEVPAGVETWTLKTEGDAEYGPVSRAELDAWHEEGRITAECQLLQTGAPQWQWATDLYPDLAVTQTTPDSGFVIDTGDARHGGSSVITKPAKSSVGKRGRTTSRRKGVKGSPAVTYLAYASYAICAIQLTVGILIVVLGASASAALSGSGGREARAAAGGLAMSFFVVGVACITLSIPALLSGYGLMNRLQWGRIFTLVLAALSLPSVPIGTAYGIWALIVLLDKKYVDEFH